MIRLFVFVIISNLLLVVSNESNTLEKQQYLNFLAAIKNNSTFSYFTVIKAKNLNTGEVKEVCSEGNFVMGALNIEYHDNKKKIDSVIARPDRYLEFKNKKALANISFFEYDPKQLIKMQNKYDFDKVISIIKKDKKFSIQLSDPQMKLFAHILFNRGFLTGESDCFGGNLEYVK